MLLPSPLPPRLRRMPDHGPLAVRRGRRAARGLLAGPPARARWRQRVSDATVDQVGASLDSRVPIVEVRDLLVTFAGRVGFISGLAGREGLLSRAVDGIDLKVFPGEVVALAGESGCGKTTTARTIMGLETPRDGQILFEGKPLVRRDLRKYRRRVQMVCQDPTAALNPRQTIYESVAEGLRIHHIQSNADGLTEEQM